MVLSVWNKTPKSKNKISNNDNNKDSHILLKW
jgi:hypothetical protein